MTRTARVSVVAGSLWLVPAGAWAAPVSGAITVNDISGVATLVAATLLLVTAIGLERVARGSAIADNISYVVSACVCLGASALARWVARIVPMPVTAEQIALSADVLNLVAITLLSIYFLRVRAALTRFLDLANASEAELARAQAGDAPADATADTGTAAAMETADG